VGKVLGLQYYIIRHAVTSGVWKVEISDVRTGYLTGIEATLNTNVKYVRKGESLVCSF
jgi:hypothetical protein